jgi:hypothetical protein
LVAHTLREPYIERFHLQYAQYHLYSKYRYYFALGFDPPVAVPAYALAADPTDPIEVTLDAASVLLMPSGLDFIPDALGGLYYSYQGKYLHASANFAAVAMVGVGAVLVKRFINGGEVLVEVGKLTAAQAEDLLQRLTAALGSEAEALKLLNHPRVEDLLGNTALLNRITASMWRAELLDDLVKHPQLLDEMLNQPTLLDAWKVLKDAGSSLKTNIDESLCSQADQLEV